MLLLLVEAKGLREEVYQSECDCFRVVSLASYLGKFMDGAKTGHRVVLSTYITRCEIWK